MAKKILTFPNTNTLSHFTRALACAQWMDEAGYETHIGVSQRRRFWTSRYYPRCHKILELWEPSNIAYPCLHWFDNSSHIEACMNSQKALIEQIKPQCIIGVFDFVSAISAGSIPRISINGECMLPLFKGVLGFDDTDTRERREQARIYRNFWRFAAQSFRSACNYPKLENIHGANELLIGDMNLIYEMRDICNTKTLPKDYKVIGPIFWNGWEDIGEQSPWEKDHSRSTIYINSGTLMKNERIMRAIMKRCTIAGYRVLVSSGMDGLITSSDNVWARSFLSPSHATSLADLVVCTGGVGTCYTNLSFGVPSLVVPMQPEQATNGIVFEKLGFGRVLMKNLIFIGSSCQYENAFNADAFESLLKEITDSLDMYTDKCISMQSAFKRCNQQKSLCDTVEQLV